MESSANTSREHWAMSRPIYAISHRTNTLHAIEEAIAAGANGIECDVRDDVVDHDGSFPWSTSLREWLEAASAAATRYDHFSFVYFDVKEPQSLPSLVATTRMSLDPSLWRLFSIAELDDRACLEPIIAGLGDREGIAIDGTPDLDAYVRWLNTHVSSVPSWYSYGLPSWRQRRSLDAVMPPIQQALSYPTEVRPFAKVCVWSLEDRTLMDAYLDLGVDGILVEREAVPDVVTAISRRPGLRLATRADQAFSGKQHVG
jgi:hypothetical protein